MKHLGDITKISGYTAPVVDCLIGGSPCQDLSVAGKRAGLDGERSGLYIEQVRIVKEMRAQDERNGRTGVDIRPRYMLWENVPGAFSSNKGDDFRVVLEELAKVCDENAVVPEPPKGKWTTSGCIVGDGWSIAWRVLDAQFWGTSDKPLPQRRRRISLVADFGGLSAPEILFVRQSVSGDIEPGEQKRKGASANAEGGVVSDDREGKGFDGIIESAGFKSLNSAKARSDGYEYEVSPTIEANKHDATVVYSVENHPNDSRVKIDEEGKVQALTTRMGTGGGNVPMVMECYSKSRRAKSSTDFEVWKESDTANTLNVFDVGDVRTTEAIVQTAPFQTVYSVDQGGGKSSCMVADGKAPTLTRTNDGAPVIALDRASFNQGKNAQYDFEVSTNGASSPLVARGPSAVCYSMSTKQQSLATSENIGNTLGSNDYKEPQVVCYGINGDTAGTLDSSYYKGCGMRSGVERDVVAVDCRNSAEDTVNGALQSNMVHSLNGNNVVRHRYIVRRLTPLECERLQGYPDGWTDIGEWVDSTGKKRQTSDAARYKALGNSIALPPWKWVLKRLCACYERDATMASLFDGIGGFPYLWEQLNGKGSCLWASEIEEFPVAVTKVRIGGE